MVQHMVPIMASPVGVLLWKESTIVHFLEMVVVAYRLNRKDASLVWVRHVRDSFCSILAVAVLDTEKPLVEIHVHTTLVDRPTHGMSRWF